MSPRRRRPENRAFQEATPSTHAVMEYLVIYIGWKHWEGYCMVHITFPLGFLAIVHYCESFACSVTRSTTTEFQHNDIMMKTTVQNDLRLEMALESMWIVCAHEKSSN